MKQVLSQLHNIINELQDNNLVKEAKVLDQVFTKLADRRAPWTDDRLREIRKHTKKPSLVDISGDPNLSVKDFSLGRPEDAIIQHSTAYQNLKDRWLRARDAYVAGEKMNFMAHYNRPNNSINENQLDKRSNILRANWIDAEDDLENWYIGAFAEVKAGKPVPQIPKYIAEDITKEVMNRKKSKLQPLIIEDITDEVRNRKKPVKSPTKQTSPIDKPEQRNAPSKPMAKPVAKPSAPKPQPVKKQELQEQVMPTQNNLTKDQIYFKAQMHAVDYEAKVKELGSKSKAYNVMQSKVYNSDKTEDKSIFEEWLKLIDMDTKMVPEKTPEYTYNPVNSKYTPYGPEFEASNYYEEYKSKIDALGSETKAYNDMQAKVYNADKTKGKKIYKEWLKLVDSEST
jgi:hypothetical protein